MKFEEIFGNAKWLCPSDSPDAALFRSSFEVKKCINSFINICGLGYFELYINGIRVGSDCFVPAYSDYHDRPDMKLIYPLNDKCSHRIYCMQYDISSLVKSGRNIIGVAVGGGFYHQLERVAEGNTTYGDIKLCYRINIDGEDFVSDENVRWQRGFFKSSNLFYGETLDYTDFDRKWNTEAAKESGWLDCPITDTPESEYYIQDCPTDKIKEILKPELLKNFGDYSVYAIPKNVSGYPIIRCKNANEKVVMECVEEIFDDFTLNNRSIGYGEERQIETFITDGADEVYRPYFCWFGFKYFSLTNNAEPIEIHVIHSDVAVTSDFECSDETLNWYYKTFINTQLCNMHGSVPSDCPHRERLGYTGDGQLSCDAVMIQMNSESFYRKWIQDLYDCQDKTTGHVQHTAPLAGGGGGPAGWGGAMVIVPYTFYRHYGDKKLLAQMYPNMAMYVEYMESRCDNGLIVREEKDGWCLGDWCAPEKIKIPEPFVNTTMYITQLKIMSYCAKMLGYDDKYKKLIESHMDAVKKAYFDNENSSFAESIQGADAFAIKCGFDDSDIMNNLVKKYSELKEFDTGIFGTYILLDVLFSNGNGELAVELMSNKNEVSFETMRKAGATTLWENWNGRASHSHPMFGASTQYLFEYVLGIHQSEDSVKYDSVIISPVFASELNYAKGYITTPHGMISVSWHKNEKEINIEIELCENVDAEFIFGELKAKLKAGKNIIRLD